MEKSIGVIYIPYRYTITRLKQRVLDEENCSRELNKVV